MPFIPTEIGLLLIATGKYDRYVEPLIVSARKHFLTKHNVSIHLFTDRIHSLPGPHVYHHPVEHLGFPAMTLRRYHIFSKKRHMLENLDYLFYCDIDMLFVSDVGDEVLPASPHQLTAVLHPGFYDGGGSWETHTMSTAFVPIPDRNHYYAGGFNGGTSKAYLDMAATIAANIDDDALWNHVSPWHDESHLNKYLVDHPPHTLMPGYCYPESWTLPFAKKLLALDKDHDEVRSC